MTERLVRRTWPCALLLLTACGGGRGTGPAHRRAHAMYLLLVGDTRVQGGGNASQGLWPEQGAVSAPQATSGPAAGSPVSSEPGSYAPRRLVVRETAGEAWRIPNDSANLIDRALGERLTRRFPPIASRTWTHAQAALDPGHDNEVDGVGDSLRVHRQVSVLEPRPVSTVAGNFMAGPVRTERAVTVVYAGGGAGQAWHESATDRYAEGQGLVTRGTTVTPIGGETLRSAGLHLAEHNRR